jgi:REP element-mobilizing transposase RayT
MNFRAAYDSRHHLPRLAPEFYRGFASVHWTMTVGDRRTGWLSASFHQSFREVLLHALARYQCCCPVYCLMPDHMHLMIVGWHPSADQLLLTRFLRTNVNELLSQHLEGCAFQRQSHDHVMRRDEIDEADFENALLYIARNPVEGGLAKDAKDYPYTGVMLPGFPRLIFWDEKYWRIFWEQTVKRINTSNAAWNAPP